MLNMFQDVFHFGNLSFLSSKTMKDYNVDVSENFYSISNMFSLPSVERRTPTPLFPLALVLYLILDNLCFIYFNNLLCCNRNLPFCCIVVAFCPNNHEVHIYKFFGEKWERIHVLQKVYCLCLLLNIFHHLLRTLATLLLFQAYSFVFFFLEMFMVVDFDCE